MSLPELTAVQKNLFVLAAIVVMEKPVFEKLQQNDLLGAIQLIESEYNFGKSFFNSEEPFGPGYKRLDDISSGIAAVSGMANNTLVTTLDGVYTGEPSHKRLVQSFLIVID